MKTVNYLSKLITSITALAQIAPDLALYVIIALFFGYGLHEILAAAQKGIYIFNVFGGLTLALLVIFATIVLIINHQK